MAVLVLGACSNGSDSSDTTVTPPRSTTTTTEARPASEPPTASIELTGDAGLSGAAGNPSVRCNFPDLEGLSIAVLAEAPDASTLIRVRLLPEKVTVVLSSGSGADYHERSFEGTGVTTFDAAQGAAFDSELTETAAAAGATPGDLGALTSIEGTVACGDQTPGTSTVTITGDTAEGSLNAAVLDPVRVECTGSPDGDEVVVLGLVTVGSTRALVKIGLSSDGSIALDETLANGSHSFRAPGSWTSTSDGGEVRADVVEQEATPARTLHVEGEVSCGSRG
jgi:hypothetical protein